MSLVVGSLAETVQVIAETKALNTSDGSLGNVISGTQIRELPLEGRNVVGLLALQPGVVYIPKANASTTNDPRYGSVSGSRADQSNVTLDGIDVNDSQNQNAFTSVLRVTLDAVQEFRVTTSNYGADQGRSSGAQVTLVTRSGTNAFSGAGYYVNRDTEFSSNEYFLKLSQLAAGNPSEAPLLNKHIFGGAIGGPVKRDKLFFFGNFEGLKEQRENSVERAPAVEQLPRRRADLSVRGRLRLSRRLGPRLREHAHRRARLLRPDARRADAHRSAQARPEPSRLRAVQPLSVAQHARPRQPQHRRLPLRRADRQRVPHLHRASRLSRQPERHVLRTPQFPGRRGAGFAAVSGDAVDQHGDHDRTRAWRWAGTACWGRT